MNFSKLKTRLIIFVAVVIFIACVAYLFREFQWRDAFEIVLQANVLVFLIGSIISIISFWVFRTLRWSVMLNIFGYHHYSFQTLYIATAYSLGLSMVMPLQSGEILKVEMLKKSGKLSRSDGYFALAIERLIDIIIVALITVICISLSTFKGEAVSSALIVIAILLVSFLLSYLVFHFFADQFQVIKEIKSRLNVMFQNPYLMLKSVLLTVMAWSCVILGWWTTLWSVEILLNPIDVAGLTTGMTLVNVVSFIPGSVGVSEVGISVWLNYLGFDLASANAGALMLRAYGLMLLVVGVMHWFIIRCFVLPKVDD